MKIGVKRRFQERRCRVKNDILMHTREEEFDVHSTSRGVRKSYLHHPFRKTSTQ
jgi:hypothetical protein